NAAPGSTTTGAALEALLGIPFQQAPGEFPVEIRWKDGTEDRSLQLMLKVLDGQYPSEKLSVDERHVNPRRKDMIRIKREAHEVGALYKIVTPTRMWDGPFALPVQSQVTSVFGTKRVFNGEMKSFHQGVDLKAALGTPIRAPAAGKVVLAKHLFFTGKT